MSMSADTTDLREPWRTLWRRKFLIVLTTAVVAALAFGATMLQAPRYEAATEILFETFETPVTESLFSPLPPIGVDPVRALQTEIQLVRSKAVQDSVRRSLAVDVAPDIVVEPVGQSNLIRIIAADRNADRAAAIANAYAESYIQFRRGTATDAKTRAERALAAQLAELDPQVDALELRINATPLDPAGGLSANLASEREALISEYVTLTTRLRELRVEAATTGRALVVVPAVAPKSPASPKPLIATALGVAWGALLGVAMAFIIERLRGRHRLAQPALPGDVPLTHVATWWPRRMRRVAENGSESGAQGPPFRSAGRPETVPARPPALDEDVGRSSLSLPDGETR
jgi:uncharacterized protein involved in exopolysaccharide biosynthesis